MISFGATLAAGVYVGATPAAAVYVGATQVWSADTVPATRIMHDFTNDATTSDLEGRALDSGAGYTWRTDPTAAVAVGQVAADSTGRKGYTNKNTTDAAVQDSHVIASPPLPVSAFYGRMTYHVDFGGAGTTDSWRIGGGIPWFDPLGTAGQGPKSACHTSMIVNGMFLQEFDTADPDDVIQQVTRTYDTPITDSRDLTVEWVIVAGDNAVVCKCPDGTFLHLETANVSTWLMNWVDFEIGCKNTDHRVYCTEAAADWLDDHTDDAVIAHANNLLTESGLGYGPIVKPAVAPDSVSVGTVRAATITLGSHAIGNYILGWAFAIGTNTPPAMPTGQGWTDLGSFGLNSTAIRFFWKQADSTAELFGTATGTGLTCVGYQVFDDCAGFGTPAFGSGNNALFVYPALTLTNHDGRSRVVRVGGHANGQDVTAAPAGYAVLSKAMTIFGGGTLILNDTTRGVATNPTTGNQNVAGTGGAGWVTASIEVKPT